MKFTALAMEILTEYSLNFPEYSGTTNHWKRIALATSSKRTDNPFSLLNLFSFMVSVRQRKFLHGGAGNCFTLGLAIAFCTAPSHTLHMWIMGQTHPQARLRHVTKLSRVLLNS